MVLDTYQADKWHRYLHIHISIMLDYMLVGEDYTHKILVPVPNELYARIRVAIPERQRSKVFTRLIEAELARQDEELYQAALAAENNEPLNKEMEKIESAMFRAADKSRFSEHADGKLSDNDLLLIDESLKKVLAL